MTTKRRSLDAAAELSALASAEELHQILSDPVGWECWICKWFKWFDSWVAFLSFLGLTFTLTPRSPSLSYQLLTHKCLPKLTIQLLLECSQAFGYPHSFGIATEISYSIVALDATSLRKLLPNLQSNTANMRPLLCQCPKNYRLFEAIILLHPRPINSNYHYT